MSSHFHLQIVFLLRHHRDYCNIEHCYLQETSLIGSEKEGKPNRVAKAGIEFQSIRTKTGLDQMKVMGME